MITWNPWKPVAMKNVEPYTPSEMVKEASIYSYAWSAVNAPAKIRVKNNPILAGSFLPARISWCAHVTVAPDESSITVLSNGTPHGSNGSILVGGQIAPISIAGERLEWKNAQKKAKKNITSETINNIIPRRKPYCTVFVWYPLKVASRITSLHQTNIEQMTIAIPKNKILSPFWKECINIAAPVAVTKQEIDETRGHGLGSTKWYGCFCIVLIFLVKLFNILWVTVSWATALNNQ